MAAIKIKKNKIGAVLLVLLFGLLFFLLIFKYSFVMLTGQSAGQDLTMKASEKYARSVINNPKRGNIYDRNGELLAENVNSYKLVAVLDKNMLSVNKKPLYVVDKKTTAKKLSNIIDMSEKEILDRLNTKSAFQVEFGKAGKDLTYQQKKAIEALKIPGLTFFAEKQRFYPNGKFASHLIGFAEKNPDTNEIHGMMGIEKIFDSYLSGKPGKTVYKQDIWQYVLPNSGHVTPAVDGDDVHLTLDKNIQIFVEDALDQMVKRYEPKDLFAVVADAKSGEILGYSQRPTFNPQTREGFGNKWQNDLYQETYEPGSTFKMFGLAAAIEEGVYDPKKKYMSGEREVEGYTISDWNKVGWGEITESVGFQLSSNVLMMKLQDEVGVDKMKTYYEKFGFGKRTHALFDNEATGSIAFSDPLSQKVSAFGQATTVTPIQIIQGMTSLLNGGTMLEPYYVKSIVDEKESVVFEGKKKVVGQPINKDTATKTMKELKSVVSGSEQHAFNYKLEDYEVAGKTGTAQVPDTEKGGYVQGPNPYFVSFAGYAPANDPKVIIYMGMNLAQKNDGEAYAYGVSKGYVPLMENTLKYLDVNNKTADEPTKTLVPNVTNQSVETAQQLIRDKKLEPVVLGNGSTVKAMLPNKDMELIIGDNVFMMTDGDVKLPNLKGFSKRELLAIEVLTDVHFDIEGTGYVVDYQQRNNTIKVKMASLDPLKTSPAYDQIIEAAKKDDEQSLKKQLKESENQKE